MFALLLFDDNCGMESRWLCAPFVPDGFAVGSVSLQPRNPAGPPAPPPLPRHALIREPSPWGLS